MNTSAGIATWESGATLRQRAADGVVTEHVQVQQPQHSATSGDFRAHAGRIVLANRFPSAVTRSVRLSWTRGALTGAETAAVATSRAAW